LKYIAKNHNEQDNRRRRNNVSIKYRAIDQISEFTSKFNKSLEIYKNKKNLINYKPGLLVPLYGQIGTFLPYLIRLL
jgi:hypothetical protein